jgi:UDP-galactose transporter
VCSVLFLGKTLERYQWFALTLLMLGVCSVQLSQASTGGVHVVSPALKAMGMVILLLAALCSSLAAVSFEKLLKGVKVDLWTRNLQLAVFSIMCSFVPLIVTQDGEQILRSGFFHGYTWLTWSCIAMNAFGGLLVGAVISYCDAILKDIAIGASIVVSAMGSMYFFDFQPQGGFTLGVALVSYAVPLYAGRAGMGDIKDFLPTIFSHKDAAPQMPLPTLLSPPGKSCVLKGSEHVKEKLVDLEKQDGSQTSV